jgi:nickel-type superoxide dismutase maturation protease
VRPPPRDRNRQRGRDHTGLGRLVALGAVVYLGVLGLNRSFVEVRGASMEPALWPGDRLLTLPAWLVGVRPGAVVVVRDPADRAHPVIKRVHAIVDGRVDVRGDAAARSTDSRQWGPLPRSSVRRVAIVRWPDLRTRLVRRP